MALRTKIVGLALLLTSACSNTAHEPDTIEPADSMDPVDRLKPSNSATPDAAADTAANRPDAAALPMIAFTPSRIDFVVAQAFDYRRVSLVNSTSLTLEPQVELTGSSAFKLLSSECTGPLLPRKSCSLTIRFIPKAYGEFNGTLSATAGDFRATAAISSSSPVGGLLSGKVAHWSFEDPEGSSVKDVSGMLNTGESVQGTMADALAVAARKSAGQSGFGLDLAGKDTWVRVRTSESLDSMYISGELTVAAWIKPRAWDDYGKTRWVISRVDDEPRARAFGLGIDHDRPFFTILQFGLRSTTGIPLDQWTHIAGSYDRNRIALYVNGSLEMELVIGAPLSGKSRDIVIGAALIYEAMTGFFNGVIDDVSVYNSILTTEELKQLAKRP